MNIPTVPQPTARLSVRLALLLCTTLGVAACPGDSPSGPDTRVRTVQVTVPDPALEAGATLQLAAAALNARGAAVSGLSFAWTSSDTAVARVSASGLVTAVAPGAVTIRAAEQRSGVVGTANLTVTPAAVQSVSVAPDTVTLIAGRTRQLAATLRDRRGAELGGRAIAWSSSDTLLAQVSATGMVTARAPGGPVTITATAEGQRDSARVTVLPVPVASVRVHPAGPLTLQLGGSTILTAVALDGDGLELTGRPVGWSSSDTARVRVSEAGLVTAAGVGGPATVTATVEGVTAGVEVSVIPVPVASVSIEPAGPVTLELGSTLQLQATARDADGAPLEGRAVAWSSAAPAAVSVDGTGLVTALAVGGPIAVTATVEGSAATLQVTVVPVPVASVTVAPDTATLHVGSMLQLTATTRDAGGNVLEGRAVAWSSSDAGVAAVNAAGEVTALAAGGPVTITASSEGRSGSARVVVVPAPVASVTLAPDSASLLVGDSAQFTATLRDARGNVLTGRSVEWRMEDGAVASVTAGGLVRALAAGQTRLIATAEGRSDTAAVRVSPRPVGSVSVAPDSLALIPGDTAALAATVRDDLGNVLADRPVAWSSSDTDVAQVDASGRVVARAAGTATITASSEGRSGTARVTVTPAPVARVVVSPDSAVIEEFQTTTFSAVTLSARGDTLVGRAIAWSSGDTTVVRVDANGVARGVAPGSAWVRATSEGVSDSSLVRVTPAPVARVVVSPDSTYVHLGLTRTLTAMAFAESGDPLPGRPIAWSSLDTALATVDTLGVVTGRGIGRAYIVASSEGRADTATVDVRSPISIVITPDTATVRAFGELATFRATFYDSLGTQIAPLPAQWSSSDTMVARIHAVTDSGVVVFRAFAPGEATVRVEALGASATAVMRVLADNTAQRPTAPALHALRAPAATAAAAPGTGAVAGRARGLPLRRPAGGDGGPGAGG